MAFEPEANQELNIGGKAFRFAEHPLVTGLPYGQEGRQAVVYQLASGAERMALKVFKPRFRVPSLVTLSDRIAAIAEIPGLAVCRRTVLNAYHHEDLLRQNPDLIYAVLMPWVEGPTWMGVLQERRQLTPEHSLSLARAMAGLLATMEQRGLAHCDLSGSNIILPLFAASPVPEPQSTLALVDVEQMYAPSLDRPEPLPAGSPGYAHNTALQGIWSANADRFAGAVLIAEMLGWCDQRLRDAASGENYFDIGEMQLETERSRLLSVVLGDRWGDGLARLFERAWRSQTVADCPTFGEWLVVIPKEVPAAAGSRVSAGMGQQETANEASDAAVLALMTLARRFEERGQVSAALETYRQARAAAAAGSVLALELAQKVRDLEAQQRQSLPGGEQESTQETDQGAEAELAALFDGGLAAYRLGEWAKAMELFTELVRKKPDYARNGQPAQELVDKVGNRLVAKSQGRPSHRSLFYFISGALAALTLGGAIWIGVGSPKPTGDTVVTNAVTASPAVTPKPEGTPMVTTTGIGIRRATPGPSSTLALANALVPTRTPVPRDTPVPTGTTAPTKTPMASPVSPGSSPGVATPSVPIAQAIGAVFYDLDNPVKYAFGDVRVRKALSLAINRQEMGDKLFSGYAKPAAVANVLPTAYFWDANVLKPDPYDPELAKRLLAEAGWPNGFSMRLWDTGGLNSTVGQATGGYWQRVRLTIEIVPIERGTLAAMIQPKHDPRIWNSVNPLVSLAGALEFLEYYSKTSTYKNMRIPRLDELIDKVQTTTDPAEKKRIALEAAVIAKNDYALIAILDMPTASPFWIR